MLFRSVLPHEKEGMSLEQYVKALEAAKKSAAAAKKEAQKARKAILDKEASDTAKIILDHAEWVEKLLTRLRKTSGEYSLTKKQFHSHTLAVMARVGKIVMAIPADAPEAPASDPTEAPADDPTEAPAAVLEVPAAASTQVLVPDTIVEVKYSKLAIVKFFKSVQSFLHICQSLSVNRSFRAWHSNFAHSAPAVVSLVQSRVNDLEIRLQKGGGFNKQYTPEQLKGVITQEITAVHQPGEFKADWSDSDNGTPPMRSESPTAPWTISAAKPSWHSPELVNSPRYVAADSSAERIKRSRLYSPIGHVWNVVNVGNEGGVSNVSTPDGTVVDL